MNQTNAAIVPDSGVCSLLMVSSPAFSEGGMLPAKYTCDGENVNPRLIIEGVPEETVTLALMLTGSCNDQFEWAHWLAWNISPASTIEENSEFPTEGLNYFSRHGYEGPCPKSGRHNYCFKVYALDTALSLSSATTKEMLEDALNGHVLACGKLSCVYQRPFN